MAQAHGLSLMLAHILLCHPLHSSVTNAPSTSLIWCPCKHCWCTPHAFAFIHSTPVRAACFYLVHFDVLAVAGVPLPGQLAVGWRV